MTDVRRERVRKVRRAIRDLNMELHTMANDAYPACRERANALGEAEALLDEACQTLNALLVDDRRAREESER